MASEKQKIADSIVSKSITSFTDDSGEIANVGGYAFYRCVSLTSVDFPAAVSIGGSSFEGCSSLVTASFKNAKKFDYCVFQSCSSLETLSMPAATSIGQTSIYGCNALVDWIVGTENGGTVCTLSDSNSPKNENLKIYVPDDLVDDYKAATNWSRLASKIYSISERPE